MKDFEQISNSIPVGDSSPLISVNSDPVLWNSTESRRRFMGRAGKISMGVAAAYWSSGTLAVAGNTSGNGEIHYKQNLVTNTGSGVHTASADTDTAKSLAVIQADQKADADLLVKLKGGISQVADKWPVGEPDLVQCPPESAYSISGGTYSAYTRVWSGLTVTSTITCTNAMGTKYEKVKTPAS